MANVAVMVSGGGTNLQAIIDASKAGLLPSAKLCLVVSSQRDAYALARAEAADIKTATAVKRECGSQEAFEAEILKHLKRNHIDLIVLAGFMSILSEDFTSRYPKRIINVHPSLIPAFCGEGFYGIKVHERVLEAGVAESGATVHFVNEIPDGGEIISQKAVKVAKGDTPKSLQKRVMEEAEWILLPQAVEKVAAAIDKEKGEKK